MSSTDTSTYGNIPARLPGCDGRGPWVCAYPEPRAQPYRTFWRCPECHTLYVRSVQLWWGWLEPMWPWNPMWRRAVLPRPWVNGGAP